MRLSLSVELRPTWQLLKLNVEEKREKREILIIMTLKQAITIMSKVIGTTSVQCRQVHCVVFKNCQAICQVHILWYLIIHVFK